MILTVTVALVFYTVTWILGCAKKKATKLKSKSGKSHGNFKKSNVIVNKKPSETKKQQFPPHLLNVPLAPTQAEEDAEKIKSKETVEKKQEKEKEIKVNQEDQPLLPYPDVKLPTVSERRRRLAELEKDKMEKVASGFYQSRSDEDDTLEQVESLKEELTERSRKRSEKVKKAKSVEEVSAKEDVNDFFKEAVKEVENPMTPRKQQT
ncbi:hypothetical protein Angca_001218 [Angiostrongylus cantonensis]|nr:hypothetical protein Angca_001218 [Angiostrongylus cantonensis]